jgi:DNA repair protein RadD
MTPHVCLHPYQVDVIARINGVVSSGLSRILLVAPTGSGKTVIAAEIMRDAASQGRRILFLDHRRELTKQASRKLYQFGVDHGIVQAGFPARPSEHAQIASIQTLHARAVRSRSIELPRADLVVVDEAHHARAVTYRHLLEAYPNAVILGLTATPCRGDGRGLGNVFQMLIECPSVAELIANGYLVGTNVYAPTRPDLTGVHVRRGDYVESELAARMNTAKLVGDVVEHWLRLGERRPTVVFAVDVAHSVHLRNEFRDAGVLAEHLDGSTPIEERDRILAQLASGTIDVVTNCMVLTEGWDQPRVSCLAWRARRRAWDCTARWSAAAYVHRRGRPMR